MEVKTSINVLNTLEDIFINDIDNTVEPEEESTMSKMFEDLGSGSGSEEETEDNMIKDYGDEMMTGIDPGLLETSNSTVTAKNDVEIFRFKIFFLEIVVKSSIRFTIKFSLFFQFSKWETAEKDSRSDKSARLSLEPQGRELNFEKIYNSTTQLSSATPLIILLYLLSLMN